MDFFVDEINQFGYMIKGGGGDLTFEKVCASASHQIWCVVSEDKWVDLLGTFPLAIEVLSMARSYVAREIVKLGGQPVYREQTVTDNGNVILDVYNLKIDNPLKLETELKALTESAREVELGAALEFY